MATHWMKLALLSMKANRVPFVVGAPGIGKSAMMKALHRSYWGAKADSVPLWVSMPALSDPTDYCGIPFPQEGETKRLAPTMVSALSKGGTLFIDEATLASPATWSALLRVVLERVVGDVPLHPDVRIVLAANPVQMTTAGNELPPAAANRLVHLEADVPSPTEWATWLMTDRVNGDDFDKRAAQLVGGYVSHFGEKALLAFPADESKRSGAWPSPRAWDAACALYAAALRDGDPESGLELVSATVGKGHGRPFREYVKSANLPKPRDVLTGAVDWKPDASRPDYVYPVIAGCAIEAVNGLAANAKEREFLVDAAWGVILSAANVGQGDFATSASSPLQVWRSSKSGNPRASTKNEAAANLKLFGVQTVA
jgi:hypothetical protein